MTATARLPLPHTEVYAWQRHAACRGQPADVFFSPPEERGQSRADREEHAKRICSGCPVQRSCLEHALRAEEPYGVWGGLTEGERRHLTATARASLLSA